MLIGSIRLLGSKCSPFFVRITSKQSVMTNLELYLIDLGRLHSNKHTGYTGLRESFSEAACASHITLTDIIRQQNVQLPPHRRHHPYHELTLQQSTATSS